MTIPYAEWPLAGLEGAVIDARALYVKAQNARQPSNHLWNDYARKLHALRLRKRSMK